LLGSIGAFIPELETSQAAGLNLQIRLPTAGRETTFSQHLGDHIDRRGRYGFHIRYKSVGE